MEVTKVDKVIFQLQDAMRHKAKMMEVFVNYLNNYRKDPESLLNLIINCHKSEDGATEENYIKYYTGEIISHDNSKIYSIEEFNLYTDVCYDLNKSEYGSDEYNKIRPRLDEGFALHSKENDHHPEHWGTLEEHNKIGLEKIMPLECILEMVLDWCAAALGRGYKLKLSICEQHKKKFNIADGLMQRIYKDIYLILDEKDIINDIDFQIDNK